MWVRPSLVGSSLGRKNLKSSAYFVLQAIDPQRNTKAPYFYRIITKNFPHYKVAEGDDYEEVQENFCYVNDVLLLSIKEKKTSKNIAKWLKTWYEENHNSTPVNTSNRNSFIPDDSSDDESSDVSQHSVPEEPIFVCASSDLSQEPVSIYTSNEVPLENSDTVIKQSNNTTESFKEPSDLNAVTEALTIDIQPRTNDTIAHDQVGELSGLNDKPEFNNSESLSSGSAHSETNPIEDSESNQADNWWSSQGLGVLSNWFDSPATIKKNNQDIGLWEIPIQLVALLSYPDSYPSKNPSYAELREISQVTQRRKMLVLLTVYALVIRYASFDLFLLVLFASHCTILFLMKNSTKVNMQMAKRTVRQRVNWAKQWAGGIFRKNGPPPNSVQPRPSNIVLYPGKQSSNTSPTESPNTSQPDSTLPRSQKRFFLRAKNNTSPELGSNIVASENLPSPPATKQKRRFFSKSKGNNPNLLPTIETSDIEPDGSKLL